MEITWGSNVSLRKVGVEDKHNILEKGLMHKCLWKIHYDQAKNWKRSN